MFWKDTEDLVRDTLKREIMKILLQECKIHMNVIHCHIVYNCKILEII